MEPPTGNPSPRNTSPGPGGAEKRQRSTDPDDRRPAPNDPHSPNKKREPFPLPTRLRDDGSPQTFHTIVHFLQQVATPSDAPGAMKTWAESAEAILGALHSGMRKIADYNQNESAVTGFHQPHHQAALQAANDGIRAIVSDSSVFSQPLPAPSFAPDVEMASSSPAGLDASMHAPSQTDREKLDMPVSGRDLAKVEAAMTKQLDRKLNDLKSALMGILRATGRQGAPTSSAPGAAASKAGTTPTPVDTSPPKTTHPSTYAAAAATGVQQAQESQKGSGQTSTPTNSKPNPQKPVEFVVRFPEGKLPREHRLEPPLLVARLNRKFAETPSAQSFRAVAASWTANGNVKIFFPPGANVHELSKEGHLRLIASAVVGEHDTHAVTGFNGRWTKLVIGNVLVRHWDSPNQFSPAELMEELRFSNATAFENLRVTQEPRFVLPEERIAGSHSSISLAFEDPDGSIGKKLLRTTIFMFGNKTTVREWRDKPRLVQCENCWSFKHAKNGCQATKPRCAFCGSRQHITDDHRKKCTQCVGVAADVACAHTKCLHCSGQHAANSPVCPERAKYRAPVAERGRATAENDMDQDA
jgi:hypothetical protein